ETPFVLPTALLLPTLDTACVPASTWVSYTIQLGESLYAVAQAVGSSVEELLDGNCFLVTDSLGAGSAILVPSLPLAPVATSIPVFPTDLPPAEACAVPGVRIIAPAPGEAVSGIFNLVGAASLPQGG